MLLSTECDSSAGHDGIITDMAGRGCGRRKGGLHAEHLCIFKFDKADVTGCQRWQRRSVGFRLVDRNDLEGCSVHMLGEIVSRVSKGVAVAGVQRFDGVIDGRERGEG
jgi:hypothetical protein